MNVTVHNVEKTKAGKTDRIVLHYTSDKTKGEVWKVGALAIKLDESSRSVLNTAKAGDKIGINMTKEGNYWNLTEATTAVDESARTSARTSASTKTSAGGGYDNLGQQIGNSITNAVNSLGAGKSVAEYKQRAIDLILAGNEIRELVNSGALTNDTATAANYAGAEDELSKELGF
jgi:hypothetical protein